MEQDGRIGAFPSEERERGGVPLVNTRLEEPFHFIGLLSLGLGRAKAGGIRQRDGRSGLRGRAFGSAQGGGNSESEEEECGAKFWVEPLKRMQRQRHIQRGQRT